MFDKIVNFKHNIVVKVVCLIFLGLFLGQYLHAESCEDWFKASKASETKDCQSKCLTTKTSLANFLCPQKCEEFCTDSPKNALSFLSYYGLNESEISFCSEYRLVCLSAYRLTWKAESLCNKIYIQSAVNDESDACRHYVWSIMLSREIGIKDASYILNAHEMNPNEKNNEKQMDLDNNKVGIEFFDSLKGKKVSDEDILSSFKEAISNKKLVVLKPKYQNKGGLP